MKASRPIVRSVRAWPHENLKSFSQIYVNLVTWEPKDL